jgi:hypothetical protein
MEDALAGLGHYIYRRDVLEDRHDCQNNGTTIILGGRQH